MNDAFLKMKADEFLKLDNLDVYSLVGIVITFILGSFLGKILAWLDVGVTPPAEVNKNDWETWDRLIHIPTAENPIRWLGHLERTLLYVALECRVPSVIAAWIGFKAITKWSAWRDIIKVSDEPKLKINDPIEFLRWKSEWATQMTQRSLLGLLWNLLFAGLGLLVAHWLRTKWHAMEYVMQYAGYFDMISQIASVLGLGLDIVASVLLLRYSTESKSADGTTVTQAWERESVPEFKAFLKRARVALWLLFAGFALQLLGTIFK